MLQKLRKPNSLGPTKVFNLPAQRTCPGAGACKQWCYGNKGCYLFSNVRDNHRDNLHATRDWYKFQHTINTEIERSRATHIRPHTSGDMYSQRYLNNWTAIVWLNPERRFYVYTKSHHLDWSMFDMVEHTVRIQSLGSKFDAQITNPVGIDGLKVCKVISAPQLDDYLQLGWTDGTHDDAVAADPNGAKFIVLVEH